MANSIFFFTFLLIPSFVNSFNFSFHNFRKDDPKDIIYHGDATPKRSAIEFTIVSYPARVGWATYARNMPLWDPKSGKASSFNTSFSFIIDTDNVSEYGHGFTFFMAQVGISIPPNSAAGFLGLFNRSDDYSSLFPLVHIEFDTFKNKHWEPKETETHVGININSLRSSAYTSWNATAHMNDVCHVRISYDSVTSNLSVSWSYELTSDLKEDSSLFFIVDLTKILPKEVLIGFSAATGSNTEIHRLLSWEFSIDDIEKSPKRTVMIIGISVSGFVLITSLIIISMILIFWRRKQRKIKAKERANLTAINKDLERGAGPRRFIYKDLVSATNNFLNERKLGEGGFGMVYKGYLNDLDTMIAVKRFAGRSKQGMREFVTEVKIISSLRHRNLVQLIGWCNEKDEFLLIYEFMPNGSLDSHLFGKRVHLIWAVRYKITLGLASALQYLHEEWEQCVVHRDIKPSNIMLDSNFNAKLGDFGLARLMDHELGPQTTGLAGTFGYMAPEYISTGRASKESDIYSFGVVALEIVTGKKAVDRRRRRKIEPEPSLVERIWDLYGKEELFSAVDEKLSGEFDRLQAECLMVVGLWCAHPNQKSRPCVKQVIKVLNFEAPLPNLPPKMPFATYESSSSTTSGSYYTQASVTISSSEIGR